MSLQFVLGNPGSGKSYNLYQWIIDQSIEHPDKNYIIIVPEQFTMQTQMELTTRHPRGGIMNIDVLSFGRLAFRVLEEVGGMHQTILDDEGKSLILRKIAGDYEKQLKVLRGNLRKPGYISEIKSIISEFTQYDVSAQAIDDMVDGIGEQNYLSYKLRDIQTVYRGFSEYLEGKYITKEEILDVLSVVVKDAPMLRDSVVALDGFTGFTPVQGKVLREMMLTCEKVVVTATIDGREDAYVLKHKYQLFALSKQMVTSLVKIAKENRVIIDDPMTRFERPIYRFRHNQPLAFLESELFRYSRKQYREEQEVLSLHCARDPRGEVTFTAGEILNLIRNKGYRYRDIAVITNDMSVYTNCVDEVFTAYDIPVFMDQKRSILLNSFVEYVRSLLAMAEGGYTKAGVLRFLRTGLFGFTDSELDLMENYVTALGIKGYKRWQEKWIRRSRSTTEAELEILNSMREQFIGRTQDLVAVFRRRVKTVRDITLVLYKFFVQEEIQKKLSEQERYFENAGDQVLAKEYAQVYRIVMDLFDKFVELLGDERMSLKEYMELLDAGFEEAKVGIIPPGMDQVMIGDLERTRLKEIKALFLLGANDTILPGNLIQGGFLSERDREQFESRDIRLSPGSKEKIYVQKFYLYLQLTKPAEKLYLSYAQVSPEGAAMRPAYLVSEIRRLFPLLAVQNEELSGIRQKELTPQTGISYLISELQDKSRVLGNEWKELYSWYLQNPEWSGKVQRLVKASFYKKPVDKLTAKIAESLYGTDFTRGVTRLERFSACAFAHFLTYGLKLREREQYEFAALDMGNVFHSALERFSQKLSKSSYGWTDIPEAVKEDFIAASVDESITDYGNSVLYSSARNQYMITRMTRLMHRTVWAVGRQLEEGDFKPSGYEIVFPSGKIDRVDTYEEQDKVYVKVLDYKTGSKSFDIVALYHGLQMQLAVYLNAAMELEEKKQPGKEVIPAGIFYYQIKDPIVDKEADLDKLEEAILKELRLDGLLNSEPDVIEHLEHNLSGNSLIIPAGRKKDGSLAKTSKAVSTEAFQTISRFVEKQSEKIRGAIMNGETEASPYEYGRQTGCDYCQYRNICGFDQKIEGYEYRRLTAYEQEEVLRRMEDEV